MLSLLNIRTRRFVKKNKTQRFSVPYKKASQIGILFSVEDKSKHDAIKEFIKNQEHEGKNIKVISYLPEKKENYDFLFNFFTARDFSFWGKITSYDAIVFSEIPFDYLYCFDTRPNPYILHLLARCKAKCRIGQYWAEGEPYFEMMIQAPGNAKTLIDEQLKYTKGLR